MVVKHKYQSTTVIRAFKESNAIRKFNKKSHIYNLVSWIS